MKDGNISDKNTGTFYIRNILYNKINLDKKTNVAAVQELYFTKYFGQLETPIHSFEQTDEKFKEKATYQ